MSTQKGKTIMKLMLIALSVTALMGMCGCRNRIGRIGNVVEDGGPEKGGTVKNNNIFAPKTIKSKDISEFYTDFGLRGEWSYGNEDVFYTFRVKPDSNGDLTVSEDTTGVSAECDDELLKALQEVIDEYKLVGLNGENTVTQGLPPEYAPCSFEVIYASGEELYFRHNNYPDAEWAKAVYKVFSEWFEKKGENALKIPTFEYNVTHLQLFINESASEKPMDYFMGEDEDGKFYLDRINDGKIEKAEVTDKEKLLEDLSRIVNSYDLRRYNPKSALYGYEKTEKDKNDPFGTDFALTFWYGDGSEQLFINTSAPEAIEDLMPIADELTAYFDTYFEE